MDRTHRKLVAFIVIVLFAAAFADVFVQRKPEPEIAVVATIVAVAFVVYMVRFAVKKWQSQSWLSPSPLSACG